MDMNVQVLQNSNDITGKLISYERNMSICSGIGTLDVTFERTTGLEFDPWDEIILYENNIRKGTFYVSEVTKSAHLGTIEISCIDGAKKLLEYYITDVYEIDYVSYAKYWLEKFLDEAGVSYSINAEGNGSVMSNNTSIGPEQAYDVVLRLLQMCGWYMYFDGNGTCQIGALVIDTDSYDHTFYGDEVISVETNKNDKMLRNRAVVWGNSDPDTNTWVFADRSVITPYNYDSDDKRASVLANSNIDSVGSANILANKMLDEFSKITHEKTITLVGVYNVHLGEVAYINTNIYNTVGMITSLASNMSASGLTTTIILDQRCPRLFGYYGYLGYVYIGTYGSGVWRKLIEGSTWSDFSTGLGNLHIIDLYIRDGIFACVTGDGNAYCRTLNSTGWTLLTKPEVTYTDDDEVEQDVSNYNLKIIGCTVNNDHNLQFIAHHRNDEEVKKSWAIEYSSEGTFIRYSLIETNDSNEHICIDIDGNSSSNIITTKTTGSEIIIPVIGDDDGDYGDISGHPYDGNMIPALPPVTHPEYQMALTSGYLSQSTTLMRGYTLHTQNTEDDRGIVYQAVYSSTSGGRIYLYKYVYEEEFDEEWGWSASWYGDGYFNKYFAYSLFEGTDGQYIRSFHVIDDNTFSFITVTLSHSANGYIVSRYVYNFNTSSMSKTVVLDTGAGNMVDFLDDITSDDSYALFTKRRITGYTYTIDCLVVDHVTGASNNLQSNLLTTYDNLRNDGVIPDTTSASFHTRPLLVGSTVYFTTSLVQGYSDKDVVGAAEVFVNTIAVGLNSQSLVVIPAGIEPDGLVQIFPKFIEDEHSYVDTFILPSHVTRGDSLVFHNQYDSSGMIRLTISFIIRRKEDDFPYDTLYSNQIIESYVIEPSSGDIYNVQSSSTLWDSSTSGNYNPGSPITYPERYDDISIQEYHYGDGTVHLFIPLCGNTFLVADSAGNYSGTNTGSPVFRNAITFEIVSGIEAPIGLGDDLEYRTTPMNWITIEEPSLANNDIILLSSLGTTNRYTQGTNRDALDGARYLLVGRYQGSSNFGAYLIGYDDGGNIIKRFYGEYERYEWNDEIGDFEWVTYHDEALIGSSFQIGSTYKTEIRGNIIYVSRSGYDYFGRFYNYELPEQVETDVYYALRQDYSNYDNFTVITDHTYPLKVDISKETPTVVYSRTVGSGIASVLRTSYTNAVDDFNVVTNERRIIIHEARPFSVIDEGNFYVYSGALEETGVDYILAASTNDVRFIEASLAGEWNTLASFDELVSHIETTNYTMNAYFFVSLSGESDTHRFFQRNKDGISFIEYSAGLPSGSGITIIRTDDKI